MENLKPIATPIAARLVLLLIASTLQVSAADILEFQPALESLMYAITQTRLDLGYTVSKLS
jgi:hypothetical protein